MSFTRSASEIEVSGVTDATVTTLSVAEAGLDAFFSDTFTVRPQPGDSFRYNVVDGYAWVVPIELQRPADTVLNDVTYSVRSTGYLIQPNQGAAPMGIRTMVQFARWQIGSIQTQAMYTSANGITHRTTGGYFYTLGGALGSSFICNQDTPIIPVRSRFSPLAPADSSTPVAWLPVLTGGVSDSAVAAQTGIDWASIVGGTYVPDYYAVQYGDTVGFTTQLITGNLTLSPGDRGSGLLIVTGNLTTTGSGSPIEWRGIVVVGGQLRANAAMTIFRGVVVTGMNTVIGAYVPDDSVGGNAGYDMKAEFLYEECLVDSVLTNLTGMVPVRRARVDNWATY